MSVRFLASSGGATTVRSQQRVLKEQKVFRRQCWGFLLAGLCEMFDHNLVQTNMGTAVSNLGCRWVAQQGNIVISRRKHAKVLEFSNFFVIEKTLDFNVKRPLGVLEEQIGSQIRVLRYHISLQEFWTRCLCDSWRGFWRATSVQVIARVELPVRVP